jgi:hypothetical protein
MGERFVDRRRPWMTALEMQFSSLSDVRRIANMADVPKSVTDYHVLRDLARSTPFSWSRDVTSAVWMASKTIPGDACFDVDLLPDGLSHAFWWLEWPLPLPMKHPENWNDEDESDIDLSKICCLLISREGEGWIISCGRMSTLGYPLMIEVNRVVSRASLGEITHIDARMFDALQGGVKVIGNRDVMLFRFVLAASVWLKQRVVSMTSGAIERHRRKQIAREHDANVSDVKVVQLRRSESQQHQSVDGSEESIEWSCRWIVNGHWRNQPYANGERKLIYILPYVKGPEDKPLKVPTHAVYAVNR